MALSRKTPLRRGDKQLKRGPGPQSRTRMKAVNRKRARERRARDFGSKAAWISTLPCIVCGRTPSDAHHYPTRGAGGTSKDLTPLCREHHTEFHAAGAETFQLRHRVDLLAHAATYHRAWLIRGGEAA